MKRSYLGFIAAVAAGLWSLFPVEAQEMRWQYREGESRFLYLSYEIPETGMQSLILTCDIQDRQFSVNYVDDRDRVRDGMRAEVEFASEKGQISLSMLAEQQELDNQVMLGAETSLKGDLLKVLNGKTLRVTLSEDTENIPLAGAKKGLSLLAEACS
ncbi:hypothetical protein KXR64_18715 [Brucella intermedia]|uniref:Invasion associated locus B family protein n=1 Tax=Brucella ciceri TaxID=391287 RepID=A0ABX1DUZ2_9HYPH|nr:hypothetical protein [Brucella intermedia]NKC28746.1 hypothetical protein [Brucella ciceri]